MNNILQFKPKPTYIPDRERKYTIGDLKAHNYRGTCPDGIDQFSPIDAAYGALIASKLAGDTEAAQVLLEYFHGLITNGQRYGTMSDLPAFARGYVANTSRRLLACARATASPLVK